MRRNSYMIEKDVLRIKEASKNATSLKEIASKTGLSVKQVITSLKFHPIIYKRVKKAIEDNNPKNHNDLKENLCDETQVFSQKESETQSNTINYKHNFINEVVVMDTSCCGIKGIVRLLKCQKIVYITDDTIKELKKLKDSKKAHHDVAAYILFELAQNHAPFESVFIEKISQYVDDNIIEYCYNNKEKVILFTADQEMAALARGRGIRVEFFEQEAIVFNAEVISDLVVSEENFNSVITLDMAYYNKGRLIVTLKGDSNQKRFCILSRGHELKKGTISLKKGDDIFLAKRRADHVVFTHFSVISISKNQNAKLIYSGKIYSTDAISKLPDTRYMKFLDGFI